MDLAPLLRYRAYHKPYGVFPQPRLCYRPPMKITWEQYGIRAQVVTTAVIIAMLAWSPLTVHAAPESAPAAAQRPSEANPRSLEANEQGIAALKTGNTRTAEERFRRALEVEPGNLTAAFNLAGTLVVNGKKLEAIALLSDYAKKYPDDTGFAVRLGDVLFSSEKVKEAIPHYERALKMQATYPKLYEKLALGYALTQRLSESETMYELAVQSSPKDGNLLTNLASIQLANNKTDAAIKSATRASQLAPSSRLYITLGSAFENKGALSDALASFKRAKELGDSSKEIEERIAALETKTKAG